MNQRLVLFTKRLLDAMFYLGIVLTISLPFLFRWAGAYLKSFRTYYLPLTILYVLSGVLCLMIVAQLRNMFDTVLEDNAFVYANVTSLKSMGKYSFLISILSIARIFFSPTPATVVVVIVFAIAGLFSIVLCQVFEKAVRYKEENDLTIEKEALKTWEL